MTNIKSKDLLTIKSPNFEPRPGWGGKIKKWLSSRFESKILPPIAISVLAAGIYLIAK